MHILRKQHIPWLMAAARAALGPVLIAGAACAWSPIALAGLVVTALLSDIFDGVLARRWKCDTPAVRLFDSTADAVFYLSAAVALWLAHPEVWRENGILLAVLLLIEVARYAVEFAKFGKPASYHSYLAKTWGLVLAIAITAAFAFARSNPLIPAALWLGIACNLEGLAMSLILPVWRNDIKTLARARYLRDQLLGEPSAPRLPVPMKAQGFTTSQNKPLAARASEAKETSCIA